jgi:hypothetical protein
MKKRGQFSHGDFIIGFVIFTMALILFYKYYPHLPAGQDQSDELLTEGKLISDSFLSGGYPADWTTGNVVMIGLTNGNSVLNESKLSSFYSMDYQETRHVLDIKYNYYLYFACKNGSIAVINGSEGKGYPGITPYNADSIETGRLTKISRLVLYDSQIVEMVLLLW